MLSNRGLNQVLEFVCGARPNKRALMQWRWWRPGKVVLVLQERGESGWRTLHRTILRDQHEGRALTFAATWLGVENTEQILLRVISGNPIVTVESATPDENTE